LDAPPSYLSDAVAVIELARYQEGPSSVVVSRDGDELRFSSSYDDYGRTITEESRIPAGDFVAKGEGPWPWYDLGDKREGTDLFDCARAGSTEVIELLAWGAEPDPVDPCGASPLWYGVRYSGYRAEVVVKVIDVLRAGGAAVTDRHRELAATAGASQVEAALRS
jgi:hypothetical protein